MDKIKLIHRCTEGENMTTVWLTYAWDDNKNGDVDFIAQEIESVDLKVKLDRWNLQAGKRLWEQIDNFIQNPAECDGWILYATQNSLGSEPCKEEFAYALDRALKTRGQIFPVIGLFPSSVDEHLIPTAIKTRLYISTIDPDWKERIKSAVENRSPNVNRPIIEPYFLKIHESPHGYNIEVRPRAGTWSPFISAIPTNEKDKLNPYIMHGPAGRVPTKFIHYSPISGLSKDEVFWVMGAQNEATPSQSYYIYCKTMPNELIFGVEEGIQYTVRF